MNYQKHYNLLIESRKRFNRKRNKEFYYENHHIIPKCLNGSNDEDNLVLLTAREHYVAHWLLTKIYPNSNLADAFGTMVWNKDKRKLTAKQYERARLIKRFKSEEHKKKIGLAHKGKIVSEETKIKMREGCKNRPPLSEETIAKQVLANTGRKRSQEFKDGVAYRNSLRTLSEETKQKIRESNSNLPKKICPFCGTEASPSNATKWHFNNCKENPNALPRPKQKRSTKKEMEQRLLSS